jgi:hypothetical protein
MIFISEDNYLDLKYAEILLDALKEVGVNEWEGYLKARAIFREKVTEIKRSIIYKGVTNDEETF